MTSQLANPTGTTPNATTPSAIDLLLQSILEEYDVQPVLFVGAGLSRRYIGAPDWQGSLKLALSFMGGSAPAYSYFVQKHADDMVAIGTAIGDVLFEWAWKDGKDAFPKDLFLSTDKYVFIKHIIARHLLDITPDAPTSYPVAFAGELEALRAIRPHAVITTNYDSVLETIFDGYEPIVGKGVLRYDLNSFGEIFHIHGDANSPESIVLTQPDYDAWGKQSRYFAAKLLTYFVEHPIFIFGYGITDPNVKTVLRDIGRIVSDDDGLIPNVVQVVWHPELKTGPYQSELVIEDEEDGRQYRLHVVNVTSLLDIYKILTARHELKQVNPAMLRALAARLMKLTRKDIPGGTVEVNYEMLEKAAKDDAYLPTMLGLTFADSDNKTHPLTLTQVAEALGFNHWTSLTPTLKRIEEETGRNLRADDNYYHERIKTGKAEASATRKWSHGAVDLFRDVLNGKPYTLID